MNGNKNRNFLGRIKTKVLDEVQVCWIFHKFTETNTNRGSVLATGSPGLVNFFVENGKD